MTEAGKSTMKAQEVRLLDIAADAGAGMVLFEKLPKTFQRPADFANYLKAATRKHFGTPLQEFLRIITSKRDEIEAECRKKMEDFATLVTPHNATGLVLRAVQRFGLVAAAGEIATKHRLTGWKKGEAILAAQATAQQRGGTSTPA